MIRSFDLSKPAFVRSGQFPLTVVVPEDKDLIADIDQALHA
jgi:hypothetical protein